MRRAVVMIGIGEIGGVLARGLLRAGWPIVPVTRGIDPSAVAAQLAFPEAVVVAVAETDLPPLLRTMPRDWRDRLVLLQNELLPRDWQAHGIAYPTVAAIWFEKKRGQDVKVLLPTPVYGARAALVASGLEAVGIPSRLLSDVDELQVELVRKNVYILTVNIAGLLVGGTVAQLWRDHRGLAETVAGEVMDIQAALTQAKIDRPRLLAGLVEGIEGDPAHLCAGCSAPARLVRALRQANEAGLAVPTLREIRAGIGVA